MGSFIESICLKGIFKAALAFFDSTFFNCFFFLYLLCFFNRNNIFLQYENPIFRIPHNPAHIFMISYIILTFFFLLPLLPCWSSMSIWFSHIFFLFFPNLSFCSSSWSGWSFSIEFIWPKRFHGAEWAAGFWVDGSRLTLKSPLQFAHAIYIIAKALKWLFYLSHLKLEFLTIFFFLFLPIFSLLDKLPIFPISIFIVLTPNFFNHRIDLVLVFQSSLQLLVEVASDQTEQSHNHSPDSKEHNHWNSELHPQYFNWFKNYKQ